jgi:hypothetical protein
MPKYTQWAIAPRSIAASLAIALTAATYLLAAYPVLRASWYGASQFQDDTFYYLVTAANFLHLGRFTFDGTNVTNGFQPLWMAAIVAAYKVIGPDSAPELRIFAVTLLEKTLLGLAVGACVLFFARSLRQNRPWAIGYLAAALVLLCPFYFVFDQGMETTLAALLLLIVIRALLSDRFVTLGVALALLFLTRLDTAVFVATPLLLWIFLKAPRAKDRWLAIAIFATTFACYVGINLATTGHAVPISGVLKSSFPVLRWQAAFFTEPITLAGMFGWGSLLRGINIVECTGLVVLGLALIAAARPPRDVRQKLFMLGAVATLLIANLLMFQKWEKSIDPRYLAMPMLVATVFFANAVGLVAGRLGEWLPRRLAVSSPTVGASGTAVAVPRATAVAGTLLRMLPLLLVGGLLLAEADAHLSRFGDIVQRRDDAIKQLFLEIDRTLPPDAILAGTDVGALAFWTRRRVVNLDGVINNFEYQEYLRAGDLRGYLRRQGVTFIATALWDRAQTYTGRPIEPMYRQVLDPPAEQGTDYPQHEFFVYSYLYGVYSDKIALKPRDEVYRKFLGKNGIAETAYVIYRLPG